MADRIPVEIHWLALDLPEGGDPGAATVGFKATKPGSFVSGQFTVHRITSIDEGIDAALSTADRMGMATASSFTLVLPPLDYSNRTTEQQLAGIVMQKAREREWEFSRSLPPLSFD